MLALESSPGTNLQHSVNRFFCSKSHFFVHRYLGRFIFHTEIKLFQCVAFHMWTIITSAGVIRWGRNECFIRVRLHHLV